MLTYYWFIGFPTVQKKNRLNRSSIFVLTLLLYIIIIWDRYTFNDSGTALYILLSNFKIISLHYVFCRNFFYHLKIKTLFKKFQFDNKYLNVKARTSSPPLSQFPTHCPPHIKSVQVLDNLKLLTKLQPPAIRLQTFCLIDLKFQYLFVFKSGLPLACQKKYKIYHPKKFLKIKFPR